MKFIKLTTTIGLLLTCFTTNATENEVIQLNEKVEIRIQQLQEIGFLPTSLETETIVGDIVNEEVYSTNLTISQAVEKYELTPIIERYLQKKEADRIIQNSVGTVYIPPK
jgi:hypothetical protein